MKAGLKGMLFFSCIFLSLCSSMTEIDTFTAIEAKEFAGVLSRDIKSFLDEEGADTLIDFFPLKIKGECRSCTINKDELENLVYSELKKNSINVRKKEEIAKAIGDASPSTLPLKSPRYFFYITLQEHTFNDEKFLSFNCRLMDPSLFLVKWANVYRYKIH